GWASSSIAVTCFIIRTFQVPPRTGTEPADCFPNKRERPGGAIYPATAAVRTEMKVLTCFRGIPVSWRQDTLSEGEQAPRQPLDQAVSSLRSEEHTSELQSLTNLVCRLLL